MVLTCSTRPGATGPAVADWLLTALGPAAAELGVEFAPVSLGELDLPFLDEEEHPSSGVYRQPHTLAWSRLVDAADAFIVVTPEYNYGMPATLKNALDYLSAEWAWKPMGFVSYGNTSAGTRSVQHAKQVITTLRLVPLGETIAIRLGEMVEDGRVLGTPRLEASATRLLDELVRLAHALAPMREAARPAAQAGPIRGSHTRPIGPDDAGQVMVLQRCCWVDEARANATLELEPLHESLADVERWLAEWTTTGLWLDGRLIGMFRTRLDGRTGHIGRLAVVPDLRGRGIGRRLLRRAIAELEPDCDRLELSTGSGSEGNLALYASEGFEREAEEDGVVRLGRIVRSDAGSLAS
ncbi:NAD(P)H-dependent oxidoreductase [Agromyces archimandritae]|uniref:NAD(P)H-dependent oxidoreductase n=2 Tax=Agromyces archimandritae TaxID=2781962 RepID=A0A975FQ38_9MICO|nr:NAD(P)H-dependent oxidoreductase [Agromyces archimandritae]